MSYKSNWSNGGWITICDACGRKFKDSELKMRWDGLMVCAGDWEIRQPQDFVRGVADIQAPPYVRPEQANSFLPYYFTQYPQEEIGVVEGIAKSASKKFGNIPLASKSAINGAALNAYAFDATVPNGFIDPEAVTLTESVLFTLGRDLADTISTPTETISRDFTKVFADTVTVAESLALVEVERVIESLSLAESVQFVASHGIMETVGVAESVSTVLVLGASRMINGSALNSLGVN